MSVLKYLAIVACCLAFVGCGFGIGYEYREGQTQQPVTLDVSAQNAYEISRAQNTARVAIINAQNALAVARIDADTNKVKAKAQAEINAMIEDSVKDKSLLKNWNLGTDGVTWQHTATGNGNIYYYSCCNMNGTIHDTGSSACEICH